MTLLEAIARIEGFFVPNSRANRNNNPGNIQWGEFAQANGATRIEAIPPGVQEPARFAYFPTAEIGFSALHSLLSGPSYSGLTIEEAINKYAPPVENNTNGYVEYVCRAVGCQPTDLVSEVLG
jgi:hypothetical protein